jgi:hypothetical protein
MATHSTAWSPGSKRNARYFSEDRRRSMASSNAPYGRAPRILVPFGREGPWMAEKGKKGSYIQLCR